MSEVMPVINFWNGMSLLNERCDTVSNKCFLFQNTVLAGNKILADIKFAIGEQGGNIFRLKCGDIKAEEYCGYLCHRSDACDVFPRNNLFKAKNVKTFQNMGL